MNPTETQPKRTSVSTTFEQDLEAFKSSMVAISNQQIDLCSEILSQCLGFLKEKGSVASVKELEKIADIAIGLQAASRDNWAEALSVPALKELITAKQSADPEI